jgi:hypothetical protein
MADRTGWLTDTTHVAQAWRDADLDTGREGDVALEIADDPVSVTLVRGSTTVAAQTVRLLHPPGAPAGTEAGSPGGEQTEADLVVLGESDFDVQRGDRFTTDGEWYEVFYVQPAQSNRVEALARQGQ